MRDELLDAVDKIRSGLGFQVFGVEIDTPPDIEVAAVITRYSYFGDNWYIAADRKLKKKEAEICVELSTVLDSLRASFLSRDVVGPAYDTESGFDFDGACEQLEELAELVG